MKSIKTINKTPLVSICMITYGHENYVKQAIDGVLMQEVTFDMELIISNDCSPDGTHDVIQHIIKTHPKGHLIKYFEHSENQGMIPNFVFALKKCRGNYVALCEGDDYWTDSLKLEKQVNFLEKNSDYVISCHNASVIDEHGKLLSDSRLSMDRKRDFSSEELMCGRQMLTLSLCFKNVIKEFPKEYFKSYGGDTFLISLLGQFGKSKYQAEIKKGVYRIHSGGVWNSKSEIEKLKAQRTTYINMSTYFKRKNKPKAYNALFKKYYNVSKTLIGQEFEFKNYYKIFKLYFQVSLNCFKYGYSYRALSLAKFIFVKGINTLKIN